jgi:beta-galactosidase
VGRVAAGQLDFSRAGANPETTGFAANARLQLQELIRQQFNHASVGMWSIANEVTGGNNDSSNNVQPLLASLNQTAKTEDPGRITTLANQVTRNGDIVLPDSLTQTGYTDAYGVNRYFQWYYGTSETQLGQNLDDIHAANPTQMIGVSEYGAGNALTHHTDNVYGGRVCSRDTSGFTRICYQPEGYANYVHEKAYAQIVARPYLMGSWIWNMFDFGSGNRHEGDIGQTNTKGIVTFGRDVKKDVFYFYKANWTNTPVTYITGRRYTERAYTLADVKVYSNADSVVLRVNDAVVATKAAAECPLHVCEFPKVPLRPGATRWWRLAATEARKCRMRSTGTCRLRTPPTCSSPPGSSPRASSPTIPCSASIATGRTTSSSVATCPRSSDAPQWGCRAL